MGYPKNEVKQYTADRFKQYLITRSVAAKMAVDLCLGGKITLEQVPTYTDKFTLLHFGQIQVEPEVDREILRLSTLDKSRRENLDPSETTPPDDKPILCEDCGHGKLGADECKHSEGDITDCTDYFPPGPLPTDEDAEAEARRQEYEDEQQRAEDEASNEAFKKREEAETTTEFECNVCHKKYKKRSNCIKHLKKVHGYESGDK